MALGGRRYGWRDIFVLMIGMFAFYGAGWWALNQPFDPASRILPTVYFSASWHWQPGAGEELQPRPEVWGGLLVALLGAWVWAGWARGDRLARHLMLWGMLGGLGFPLGQCLQSWHAWNRDLFTTGIWAAIDPTMNWWNWMETTFGAVMGACLGLGLWLNRRAIGDGDDHLNVASRPWLEWTLVCVHVALLVVAEFTAIAWANALYDPGLVIAFIPLVAVASGRWWPVLLVLPITLVPIAGKTIRSLVYQSHAIGSAAGWMLYGVPASAHHHRCCSLVLAPGQSCLEWSRVRQDRASCQRLALLWPELRVRPISLAVAAVDHAHSQFTGLPRLRCRVDRGLLAHRAS